MIRDAVYFLLAESWWARMTPLAGWNLNQQSMGFTNLGFTNLGFTNLGFTNLGFTNLNHLGLSTPGVHQYKPGVLEL